MRRSSGSFPPTRSLTSSARARRRQPAIDVFTPEEVLALVRAAADEQDAALFLTAAFTGLRQGELVALRWRDVDFAGEHIRVTASYTTGQLTSPKSGQVRSVPMAPAVAQAWPGWPVRRHWTGDDDLVFPGVPGTYLDASALLQALQGALDAPACGRCASTTCATRSARR